MSIEASLVSASQDGAIALAVEKLLAGKLVALPTETVYGLAANALDEKAVAKIFNVKGRPSFNPLICHVSSIDMAERYVNLSATAKTLAQAFWPGPLTIVAPQKPETKIVNAVSANLGTLAVRCPNNAVMRSIIEGIGAPLAAPSANKSGRLSPTTAQSVIAGLGKEIALVIDGGQTDIGIESTIVSVIDDQVTLLRPGIITPDEITAKTGQEVMGRTEKSITAPGQLASHYAPKARVCLDIPYPGKRTHIGFGNEDAEYNLSPSGDLHEAAHNLFEVLRMADAESSGEISISPIPKQGVGIAINDRLKRAAAPRHEEDDD